jgi:outer membrane protein assembly factor BamB
MDACIVNDVIYYTSNDCKLHALNAETGVEAWSYLTGAAASSSMLFQMS